MLDCLCLSSCVILFLCGLPPECLQCQGLDATQARRSLLALYRIIAEAIVWHYLIEQCGRTVMSTIMNHAYGHHLAWQATAWVLLLRSASDWQHFAEDMTAESHSDLQDVITLLWSMVFSGAAA